MKSHTHSSICEKINLLHFFCITYAYYAEPARVILTGKILNKLIILFLFKSYASRVHPCYFKHSVPFPLFLELN